MKRGLRIYAAIRSAAQLSMAFIAFNPILMALSAPRTCVQATSTSSTTEVQLPGYGIPVSGRWLGPSQDQSGIPLGGIGAGFVELRPDGLIHDTVLRNNWQKPAPIEGCGLTFTALSESAALISTVSEASGSLKPTPRYFGHFPIADLDFGRPTSAPISVWVRAYSAFEPQELDNSSIPAAVFSVRIHNEDKSPHRVTLQFWWDNRTPADSATPGTTGEATNSEFRAGQIRGVSMTRSSIPGSQAIAVYPEGWFVEVVSRTQVGSAVRARIMATRIVNPKDEKQVVFAFGWHCPSWKTADGKSMAMRYVGRYADARSVVENALNRAKDIETAIIGWQSRFYARGLPGWMKDALINGLYCLVRNGILLQDGRLIVCDSGHRADKFESIPVRLNASYPLLLLFPETELKTMKQFAVLQKADGEIPVAVGVSPQEATFGQQRQLAPSEFAIIAFRDWLWTKDGAFLREICPVVKKALQYAMTLDTDNDGLINEPEGDAADGKFNPYYGSWRWHGSSTYTTSIQLAALRAGEELGRANRDNDFTSWCKERYDKAKLRFEDDLWVRNYYRLFTDPEHFRQSDSCLADQLCGQWQAWLFGLGEVAPASSALTALRTIGSLNVPGTAFGAVSGVNAEGSADNSGGILAEGILPAEAWNFAGASLMAGQKFSNAELKRIGLLVGERAYGAMVQSGTIWNQFCLYSARDGKPISGPYHSGNLSIWALPFAYEGISIRPHSAPQ